MKPPGKVKKLLDPSPNLFNVSARHFGVVKRYGSGNNHGCSSRPGTGPTVGLRWSEPSSVPRRSGSGSSRGVGTTRPTTHPTTRGKR